MTSVRPPGQGPQLRLFVACALPPDVQRAIASVQDGLRAATDLRLRWVRPEGIHITLKFLGPVDASRVGDIGSALAAAIEPFELHVQPARIGSFGGNRPRVVWVGLEGDIEGLASLAERVEAALGPLGFPREDRPFAPHLTLARVPDETPPDARRSLARLLQEHPAPPLPAMLLRQVHLVKSTLRAGGAVYENVTSFPRSEG